MNPFKILFFIILGLIIFSVTIASYSINSKFNLICDEIIVLDKVSDLHLTEDGHYFFRKNGNAGSYKPDSKSVCIINKI